MDNLDEVLSDSLNTLLRIESSFETVLAAPEAFEVPEMMRLIQAAQSATRTELDRAIQQISINLERLDVYHGSRLSQVLGIMVEIGGNLDPVIKTVLTHLERVAGLYCRFLRAHPNILTSELLNDDQRIAAFQSDPEGYKAWVAFEFIGLAAMTILARNPSAREEGEEREELVNNLDNLSFHDSVAWYLREILECVDREFIILVPEQEKGFLVKVEAVRNNFHLMTLLQARLIGDDFIEGPLIDERLAAVARGEVDVEKPEIIFAAFNYHPWNAFQQDGQVLPEVMIFGEEHPDDIPEINGEQIIILTKLTVERSWETNWIAPLHDALRSDVRVLEILSQEEVRNWIKRCGEAPDH